MSQLSSAVADMVEGIDTDELSEIESHLHIVEPRHMLKSVALASQNTLDEVVLIGGRFTVSF